MNPLSCAAGLLAAMFLAGAQPAAAEVRALLVGITEYQPPIAPLSGSVADVDDLSRVLAARGARTIRAFRNGEATRAAVLKAWSELLAQSAAGDLIVVHFSGHGASEDADWDPQDEEDRKDEAFLLAGFHEKQNEGERILDDEFFRWGNEAEAKGVNVLFLFDTCHSGGLARGTDPLAGNRPVRLTVYQTKPSKPPAPPPPGLPATVRVGPNVVVLAVTSESQKAGEYPIEGQMRGLLSYVVARGLEGPADLNQNRAITSTELIRYTEPNVRSMSNGRENPRSLAPDQPLALFAFGGPPPAASPPAAPPRVPLPDTDPPTGAIPRPQKSGLPEVDVAVVGLTVPQPRWSGARVVGERSKAALIWDAETRRVVSGEGDVLAFGIDAVGFQQVIDAARVRRRLLELMRQGHVLSIKLEHGDKVYCEGEAFRIAAERLTHRSYTAVDLTTTGVVQFLYPHPGISRHTLEWQDPKPWHFFSRVREPFGADLVVLIGTDKPLLNLHGAFGSDGNRDLKPLEFLELLVQELRDGRFELGTQSLVTMQRSREAGTPCPLR